MVITMFLALVKKNSNLQNLVVYCIILSLVSIIKKKLYFLIINFLKELLLFIYLFNNLKLYFINYIFITINYFTHFLYTSISRNK